MILYIEVCLKHAFIEADVAYEDKTGEGIMDDHLRVVAREDLTRQPGTMDISSFLKIMGDTRREVFIPWHNVIAMIGNPQPDWGGLNKTLKEEK